MTNIDKRLQIKKLKKKKKKKEKERRPTLNFIPVTLRRSGINQNC